MVATHPALASCIEMLRTLVEFDSVSRNSNLEIIGYIASYLEKLGIQSDLIYNSDKTKANLLASIGPKAKGGIVLSGHTDVVPVDDQIWQTDPFELVEKSGKLFGRGTCDMKGFVACALAMAPHFQSQKLSLPIHLAFSYDEEVGCLGAPSLVKQLAARAEPRLAIIGEPTLMRPIGAHKGILSFETIVRGHEAHSSNTHKGLNAITIAAELVMFLKTLADEQTTRNLDERFDPPYSTVHIGVIDGGAARNIVPGECHFHWEIRPLPKVDVDAILEKFQTFCEGKNDEIKVSFPKCGITTKQVSLTPGMSNDFSQQDLEFVLSLCEANALHSISFGTEGGIFQRGNIPAVVCGPGSIDQAHQPNEFIAIEQLDRCLHFLDRLLLSSKMI